MSLHWTRFILLPQAQGLSQVGSSHWTNPPKSWCCQHWWAEAERLRGRGLQCLQPGVGTETETWVSRHGDWAAAGRRLRRREWRSVILCLAFTGRCWPCPGSSSDSGSTPTPTPTLRLTISYQLWGAGPGCSRHLARHWPECRAQYWAQVQTQVWCVHPDPRPRSRPQPSSEIRLMLECTLREWKPGKKSQDPEDKERGCCLARGEYVSGFTCSWLRIQSGDNSKYRQGRGGRWVDPSGPRWPVSGSGSGGNTLTHSDTGTHNCATGTGAQCSHRVFSNLRSYYVTML